MDARRSACNSIKGSRQRTIADIQRTVMANRSNRGEFDTRQNVNTATVVDQPSTMQNNNQKETIRLQHFIVSFSVDIG